MNLLLKILVILVILIILLQINVYENIILFFIIILLSYVITKDYKKSLLLGVPIYIIVLLININKRIIK